MCITYDTVNRAFLDVQNRHSKYIKLKKKIIVLDSLYLYVVHIINSKYYTQFLFITIRFTALLEPNEQWGPIHFAKLGELLLDVSQVLAKM